MVGRAIIGAVAAIIVYLLLHLVLNEFWSGLGAIVVFLLILFSNTDSRITPA